MTQTTTFTNAQKLAAVLNSWAQPLISQLMSRSMSTNPVVSALESKVRSTGWVSNRWSLSAELSPILQNASAMIVQPILAKYIANIPDESIPSVAHGFVDEAIGQGQLSLFEGNITFDADDLRRLKRLLQLNLPVVDGHAYEVITEPLKPKTKND